uniref:3-ketoacyl-CoA thiolase n=2 Tax=Lygus hesperus TaxID=30085 RepID=A0A146LCG2_LYGHE
MVHNAYIVDCVRSPGGKRKGSLSHIHPCDLAAQVIDAMLDRNPFDYSLVDDVIMGCVSQVGAQSNNVARNTVLSSSKLPTSVPGTTVDRQCGSSQQALQFAYQAVLSGTQDIVVCGGVEVMSLVPIGGNVIAGAQAEMGTPLGQAIRHKYTQLKDDVTFSQFLGAELVAKEFQCTRDELEQFAVLSHQKASQAVQQQRFQNEIIPIEYTDTETQKQYSCTVDEGVRSDTTVERLRKLKTVAPDAIHTAGTSSQITDGASAALIMNERGLQKTKLQPKARILASIVVGDDPYIMLRGPVVAVDKIAKVANVPIPSIDLFEINEAFASVPLAVIKKFSIPIDRVNVNGGAIALGHPLGATGTKLLATLIHEL